MNIPGHGQITDPIALELLRAQRQADLDYVFNPVQVNSRKAAQNVERNARVNAQRKAALPGKKMNKAQRRAAKNERALEIQRIKEEGAARARIEANLLHQANIKSKPEPILSASLSTGKGKRTSTFKKNTTGVKRHLMNNFTVETDYSKYLSIPDPEKMTPRQLENYARQKVLFPKFQEQGRVIGTEIFEHAKSAAAFEDLSQSEVEKIFKNTIEQTQGNLLKEHLKDLKKRYGPAYRAHLRELATQDLTVERQYAYYNATNKISTSDPFAPRARLPITSMSRDQAATHISRRVAADGGTLATNKNLPGFGANVKEMIDQGFITEQDVINIVRGNNLLDTTANARQVIEALDSEELYRLPYGEALKISQSGVGEPVRRQKKFGRRILLSEKQQWMIEHSQLLEEKKIADMKVAKAQAVLSTGFKDPTIETNYAKLSAPVADEIAQVTQKKAISTRTMERLMKSHTVAAGVAAGGLGLMYAFNRKRAEEQVGR